MPTRLVADGGYTTLNIAAATQLSPNAAATLMTVYRVVVNHVSAAAGYIVDTTDATPSSSDPIVLVIPANTAAGTVYKLNWPCFQGLGVVPGASGVLAVSFSVGNQG